MLKLEILVVLFSLTV